MKRARGEASIRRSEHCALLGNKMKMRGLEERIIETTARIRERRRVGKSKDDGKKSFH